MDLDALGPLMQRNVAVRAADGQALQRPSLQAADSRAAKAEEPEAVTEPAVTVEYQRKMAKEMVKYFDSQKEQQVIEASKVFGWTLSNEIGNGRWVMTGIAVGLLTELATGVNFPGQIALLFSYLGLADFLE